MPTETLRAKHNRAVVLEKAEVTLLHPDKIVGRERFNKNGDSYMRVEHSLSHVSDTQTSLCFYGHYSMGFGHFLHSVLSSYHDYCHSEWSQSSSPLLCLDFYVEGHNRHKHIRELILLIAEHHQLPVRTVAAKTQCQRLVFFNTKFHPHPSCPLAGVTLRDRFTTHDASMPQYVALLKTTDSRLLDNAWNPRGNLEAGVLKKLFKEFGIVHLPHHDMHLREILQYLRNCKVLITCWGASSAYVNFLDREQTCLVILPSTYAHEAEKICFLPRDQIPLKKLAVSQVVSNTLPPANIAHLRAFLRSHLK